MKLIWIFLITCLILVSCVKHDKSYFSGLIAKELNYSLTEFELLSSNSSKMQFGSDFDEQFVLKLDSTTFYDIERLMSNLNATKYSSDSIIQYDRTVGEVEYVSIQLNLNQQTLTYTHWSD